MDVLTLSELMTGLLSVIGTGILLMMTTSRAPKALHDEIAQRVERSIAAIDACKDHRGR
jgi:predicted ATPase